MNTEGWKDPRIEPPRQIDGMSVDVLCYVPTYNYCPYVIMHLDKEIEHWELSISPPVGIEPIRGEKTVWVRVIDENKNGVGDEGGDIYLDFDKVSRWMPAPKFGGYEYRKDKKYLKKPENSRFEILDI